MRLQVIAGTSGLETAPDMPTRQAAEEACAVGFGRPPTYVRSGGTVPAVAMMARAFAIRPLLLGFGPPGSNAHGPDEAMDLHGWARAVETSAALLSALGRQIRANRGSAQLQSSRRGGGQSIRPEIALARVRGEG